MKSIAPAGEEQPLRKLGTINGCIRTDASGTRPSSFSLSAIILPLLVAGAFILVWDVIVRLSGSNLYPKPLDVCWGLVELVKKGLLIKYVVASLFRVGWGFTLAQVRHLSL